MRIQSLLLAALFSTTLCAKTTIQKKRSTNEDKLWQAGAMVVEKTALCATAFLILGYLASSSIVAEERLKWGAICGAFIGIYFGAKIFNATTESDSSPASGQKPPQPQTEPTDADSQKTP